jgi:hypothetical protein
VGVPNPVARHCTCPFSGLGQVELNIHPSSRLLSAEEVKFRRSSRRVRCVQLTDRADTIPHVFGGCTPC